MRVNSVAPFAENDAVKAHGARWEAANKLWYSTNEPTSPPFLRWIPNLEAAAEDSIVGAKRQPTISEKTPAKQSTGNHPVHH